MDVACEQGEEYPAQESDGEVVHAWFCFLLFVVEGVPAWDGDLYVYTGNQCDSG